MDHVIDEIREQWSRRQNWHRAEKSLTLQAKALCRRIVGGDKADAEKLYKAAIKGGDYPNVQVAMSAMMPLIEARGQLEKSRKAVEKRLVELAKKLPAHSFVDETPGMGSLGFAGIVGEAGYIGSYRNRSCFQKRMGLAVINGERQRKKSGDEAFDHGYNPSRRAVVWTIGDSLFKAQSSRGDKPAGKYREIYDKRKAYEIEKNPELRAGIHHSKAKRYMESKLLRDLYYHWRAAEGLGQRRYSEKAMEKSPTPHLIAAE